MTSVLRLSSGRRNCPFETRAVQLLWSLRICRRGLLLLQAIPSYSFRAAPRLSLNSTDAVFLLVACPQQVVRVVLVDFGERLRHTEHVVSWTGKSPRPTRTACCGHPREDVTRMLRGKRSRGIQALLTAAVHGSTTGIVDWFESD